MVPGQKHLLSKHHFYCLGITESDTQPKSKPPLDLVLIDGDHAFPSPFIDWYYTADRINKGGYVIVDDTQLSTGRILHDFLCLEKKRWKLHRVIGKTSIFKKMASGNVAEGIFWIQQPFVSS